MGQVQAGRRQQQRQRGGILAAGQDVDDDRRGLNALVEGLTAGGLDGRQPVGRHTAQDLHHLPVTIVRTLQLAADRGQSGRQHPVTEGSAVAQGARFARQHRHIVPGVVDGLAATEDAAMLPDDPEVTGGLDETLIEVLLALYMVLVVELVRTRGRCPARPAMRRGPRADLGDARALAAARTGLAQLLPHGRA